jgi:hypothetical protein
MRVIPRRATPLRRASLPRIVILPRKTIFPKSGFAEEGDFAVVASRPEGGKVAKEDKFATKGDCDEDGVFAEGRQFSGGL